VNQRKSFSSLARCSFLCSKKRGSGSAPRGTKGDKRNEGRTSHIRHFSNLAPQPLTLSLASHRKALVAVGSDVLAADTLVDGPALLLAIAGRGRGHASIGRMEEEEKEKGRTGCRTIPSSPSPYTSSSRGSGGLASRLGLLKRSEQEAEDQLEVGKEKEKSTNPAYTLHSGC
jgi:hypothetical protein